jgi:hypothetical protein
LSKGTTVHLTTQGSSTPLLSMGHTIDLQERLVQLTSLSYNEMASVAIHQERMIKVVAKVDEKKRKKMMLGSVGSGSSSGALPKYRMVYTPPGGQLCRPQQWQN